MKLHTAEWGAGPRYAVLVHGLFSDATCWHRLGPALAGLGYHVLAPDLRGHGGSPRGHYGPHDWADDLAETVAFRPELAIGHSLGGLALGLAAESLRPDTAVYLDPAWRMTTEQAYASGAAWSRWLTWTRREELRRELGSRWPDSDVELRWASMWRTDPDVIAGLAARGYDHSPRRAGTPSLVLAADPSEYVTADHAADLRRRGFVVETLAGSGHSAFREDHTRVLDRLRTWLAAVTRPAAAGRTVHEKA